MRPAPPVPTYRARALAVGLAAPLAVAGCISEPFERADFACEGGGTCFLEITLDAPLRLPEYSGHRVTFTVDDVAYECRAPNGPTPLEPHRCRFVLDAGERLTLVATSSTAELLAWSSGCPEGLVTPELGQCPLAMRTDRAVTATFGAGSTAPARDAGVSVDAGPGAGGATLVALLLDLSCSTELPSGSDCPGWRAGNPSNPPPPGELSRNQLLRAVLVGCESPSSGIVERWANAASFAVVAFGFADDPGARVIAPLGSTVAELESAIDALRPSGSTPMIGGLREAALHLARSADFAAGTSTGAIVLVSDGLANDATPVALDFACDGSTVAVDLGAPERAAEYLATRDLACTRPGVQVIRVFTIGLAGEDRAANETLARIALAGRGTSTVAPTAASLAAALDAALRTITAR